jgi:hypothetical protein
METLLCAPVEAIRAEAHLQAMVFGNERIARDRRDRISIAGAKALEAVLSAAMDDQVVADAVPGRSKVFFGRKNSAPLTIIKNEIDYGLLEEEVESAYLAARDIVPIESRLTKPANYPLGIYETSESIYIPTTGSTPMVKRMLTPKLSFGRGGEIVGVKEASRIDALFAIEAIQAAQGLNVEYPN